MFELIPMERRMANFDPFRMMADMERSFFGQPSTRAVSAFRTDVSDIGDAYKLEAELPGFKKEDISIDIKDERLTISAERKMENEENKPNYIKQERYYGSYKRSFGLEGINSDGIAQAAPCGSRKPQNRNQLNYSQILSFLSLYCKSPGFCPGIIFANKTMLIIIC